MVLGHHMPYTSPNPFDVGSGDLFLTLVCKLTKIVQWCSNRVIALSREDVEVHLHTLQTMTKQFQLCEWGHCRLGILHRSEITCGSQDAPNIQPVHVFPCSNSAMKGNNGINRSRYCYPNHLRTFPMFHCWNQAFRIVGFLGCSSNINAS
jgi:hypothetical protein